MFGYALKIFGAFSLVCLGTLPAVAQETVNSPKRTTEPTLEIQFDDGTFWRGTLEIAQDPESRKTGLMHRKTLPANHGMLFIYPVSQELHFWMKNTHVPLSVFAISKQCTVQSHKKLQPLDTRPVRIGEGTLVLEIAQLPRKETDFSTQSSIGSVRFSGPRSTGIPRSCWQP